MIGFQILNEYKTFENLSEMNEAVAKHKEHHLTENAVAVLEHLAKLASKHEGACRTLYANIAKSINVHVRTVNRAIKALKEVGAINVTPQRSKSKRGGVVSSIIQILPFIPCVTQPVIQHADNSNVEKADISVVESTKKDKKNNTNLLINSSSSNLSTVNSATELNNLMIEYISKGITKTMFLKALEESKARKPIKLVNYMKAVLDNISKNIAKKTKYFKSNERPEIKRPKKLMYDFTTGQHKFC